MSHTKRFFHSKWFTFVVFPLVLGLVAAAITLSINPKLGESVGDKLYSANKDIQSYSYAVARSSPSVVNIYVSLLNHDYSGMAAQPSEITTSASGVIFSPDGYILTNYHVIPSLSEPNKSIWAQTTDGRLMQALIVGYDRRTDLAVLKINATNLHPIPIDPSYEPQVGDIVLAIGNPNNLGQTVTHGIISATARSGSGLLTREQMNIREGMQDLIQTDAPINSGNSGGALVNTNGDLVGINTASFTDPRFGIYGIGFAVPTPLVVTVFNEILNHGRVIRGYLGISDENEELQVDNKIQGVKVGYVDPLGPAAGRIFKGDIIVKVDNLTIHNVRELIDIISHSKPGTKLTITVLREQQVLQLPVILEEDNPSLD